ncbi:MAG: ABC transporter substrate-binding protein [Pseudomonadota bacterium]
MRSFAVFGLIMGWLYPPLAAAQSIDFLMDWRPQAEQGGFYYADEMGLYDAAGIKVKLRAGGPQSDPARLLAAGAVDAAMISNAFQAMNLAALDADVQIVMAAFQKDPQILMVHSTSGVQSLEGLRGKPIFVGDASVGTFWQWLKARFGYSDSQIRKYTYSLAPWLVTPEAAQQGYITSEPFTAAQTGMTPVPFLLADNGYTGYAAMVAVTGDLARENPAAVRALVQASQRGWFDYLTGDPAKTHARILKDNREMTQALLDHARGALGANDIVLSGDARWEDVGWMTGTRWLTLRAQVADMGLYKPDLALQKYITSRYLKAAP